jgi:hypothetical protein
MPLSNILDNEFEFLMQTHQQIDVIEKLPYWKFEAFVERLNKRNDELASQRKKQEEEHKKSQSSSGIGNFNAGSFMNKFKK